MLSFYPLCPQRTGIEMLKRQSPQCDCETLGRSGHHWRREMLSDRHMIMPLSDALAWFT